jgi:hypothetical protein
MKTAVSVSIGSSTRNKEVQVELLGNLVNLKRISTDGDAVTARHKFEELDGKVDALGVGGFALCINLPWKSYPLHAGLKMVKNVHITPCTDGSGLQKHLESRVMKFVHENLKGVIREKKVFLVEGLSRYGMISSFLNEGYQCVFGDLMFALGVPIPIFTLKVLHRTAKTILPLVSRLPASMLYSTGDSQREVVPKYEKFYKDNTVIAGDWLYIKKHIPEDMEGKIIVTNTTTEEDREFIRKRGIRFLVTTTPVIDGRSFGTNAMEAALIAAAGKGRILTDEEIRKAIDDAGLKPVIQELNP